MSDIHAHALSYVSELDSGTEITADSSQGHTQATTNASTKRPGKPPLPKLRSLPTSVASSREVSPRSAAPSEAPSLATVSLARLALYRAGTRAFKPDIDSQRPGLSTGDVIAFRVKRGYLSAVPVASATQDPEAVLHALETSTEAHPEDRSTHLEVIRHDQWLGFRSVYAGDKILQARRRSPHRLVFFSPNLGTWEQWQIVAGDVDSQPWKEATITLRHRRLPHLELAVEVVRVGSVIMVHGAAVTPRSLPVAFEEESGENQQIKRMSGVLVNEWMAFAEKERRLRAGLEARVDQANVDIDDLRAWAELQVESVKEQANEEVSKLVNALGQKTAALEEVQGRLTTRVRWGLQLMEAHKAAMLRRQVLLAWRWRAARAKYCHNVETKLQERSGLKLMSQVMAAWLERCQEQRALQQRLRVAVRRMAYLKLFNAFTRWADYTAGEIEARDSLTSFMETAQRTLMMRHARRVLSSWRRQAERCRRGQLLLESAAKRTVETQRASAFAAWRRETQRRKEDIAALSTRCALSRKTAALHKSMAAWRLLTDDWSGGRNQLAHAVRVLNRARAVRALHAWRRSTHYSLDIEETVRMRQAERERETLAQSLAAWQEFAWTRAEQRHLFVSFVHARAERSMRAAFQSWRAHTHNELVIQGMARQHDLRGAAVCFANWRLLAAENTAHRLLRREHAERVQRRQAHKVLQALVLHAQEAMKERRLSRKAVNWCCQQTQARALAALHMAVAQRKQFNAVLQGVAVARDAALSRAVLRSWQDETYQCAAWRAAEEVGRKKVAKVKMTVTFAAWSMYIQRRRWERAVLHRSVDRQTERLLSSTLSAWRTITDTNKTIESHITYQEAESEHELVASCFVSWWETTAEAVSERKKVEWVARRIRRMKLAAVFSAWQRTSSILTLGRSTAEQLEATRNADLLRNCLSGWSSAAAGIADRRAVAIHLIHRRATWIQHHALQGWRVHVQERAFERVQLLHAVDKLSDVRVAAVFKAWRQHTQDAVGENCRLTAAETKLGAIHRNSALKSCFVSWRSETTRIRGISEAIALGRKVDAAAVARCALTSWANHCAAQQERRANLVRVALDRKCYALQAAGFTAWLEHAQTEARYQFLVVRSVNRLSFKALAQSFAAWREAAQARKERRTALVRFMRKRDRLAAGSAFAAWQGVVQEKKDAEDDLRRCLIRKKLTFKLFRQWYWEAVDEDLQDTLRAMFDLGEDDDLGANYDEYCDEEPPAPRSLLSSPIRRDLEAARAAGGSLLSRPHSAGTSTASTTAAAESQGKNKLPLADRVAAALAAAQVSPMPHLPGAVPDLGNTVLGPLQQFTGHFASSSSSMGGGGVRTQDAGLQDALGKGSRPVMQPLSLAPTPPAPRPSSAGSIDTFGSMMAMPVRPQSADQLSSHQAQFPPSALGSGPSEAVVDDKDHDKEEDLANVATPSPPSPSHSHPNPNSHQNQVLSLSNHAMITPPLPNTEAVKSGGVGCAQPLSVAPPTAYRTPMSWLPALSDTSSMMGTALGQCGADDDKGSVQSKATTSRLLEEAFSGMDGKENGVGEFAFAGDMMV